MACTRNYEALKEGSYFVALVARARDKIEAKR
jgi:hypothetical protein